MPKNYTKEELKNGRWVTMKGTRVFIKDGETPQDAIDRAVGKNKNPYKNQYKNIIDRADMAMELYKKTGISINGKLSSVDKDTFADVCSTLEDLQDKYNINDVPDPYSNGNDRLIIDIPTQSKYLSTYDDLFGAGNENIFARADLHRMWLNNKYYSLNPEQFDEVYQRGTDGYEPFHPKGTHAKDIIAHEAAHCMLDKKVFAMCKRDWDKYTKVQEFLTEKAEYDAMGETTLPEIKTMFNKFDKVRKKYIAYLKKDEEAVKYLGSYLNGSKKLRNMANPKIFGFRYSICEYAAKNYHELVAESFADFYANGNKAKVLSRMVCYDILDIKEAKV